MRPQPAKTLAVAGPEALASAQSEDPYFPAVALPELQTLAWSSEPAPIPNVGTQARSRVQQRKRLNKKQWAFLIIVVVTWCLLISVFLFVVIKDQWPFPLSLLP